MAFKEQLRSVDVLMIDDIRFMSGKDATQEEFFHTFNALVDQNKQIIISADKAPSDLQGLDERLRSRSAWDWLPIFNQAPTNCVTAFCNRNVNCSMLSVPEGVLEFLAAKVTSNICIRKAR